MKPALFIFICFFLIFSAESRPAYLSQKDWAAEYNRLEQRISKNFDEPEGEPNQLEPYIRWMGIKAKDRDEVKALLEEVNRLSYLNPQDKDLEQWTQKFFYLLEQAQGSGINTVNGACLKFMYVRDPQFPKIADWKVVIWRLQQFGRVIYTKAQETDFVSSMIKARAKCMINFSIRDVEGSPYGWGVYRDREGLFGYMDGEGVINIPDRDFETDCERRGEFTLTSKGEPFQPTDIGLDMIERVREEAKWWQLAGEYSDATDLMNEFFEDSMCKNPPNTPGQGHKNFYGKQALKHHLQKSMDYNEGFYGTLYGKVEKETSEGRTPAGYATVKVTDPHDGKTWEAEADSEGHYEIKDVILHKDCSPFTITAASGQDKVIDQYDGPLEKPDRSYRYEKNLLIRKSDLLCVIYAQLRWRHSEYNDEGEKYSEIIGSAGMVLTGTMLYKADNSTSESEWYEPGKFKLRYVYNQESYQSDPHCPKLRRKLSGTGTVELPESEGFDHLQLPTYTNSKYSNIAEFFINGTRPKKIHEKEWSEDDCRVYVDDFEDIIIGGIALHIPMDKNGKISGSYAWKTDYPIANAGSVPIELHYVGSPPQVTDTYPRKGTPGKEDETTVMVQWNFEKLRK
jgi:hypothetical protein